jgi:hypothetical protein
VRKNSCSKEEKNTTYSSVGGGSGIRDDCSVSSGDLCLISVSFEILDMALASAASDDQVYPET